MTSGRAALRHDAAVRRATRAQREASGDPRASVEERYGSKDAYLGRVRDAATALVSKRLMLDEDVERVVGIASQKWDAFRA